MTDPVMEQYEEVRKSGRCNMIDRECVRRVALELGLEELAETTQSIEQYAAVVQSYDPEEFDR